MTTLSNSAVAFDATDKLIAEHAGNFGQGELARLKFLEDVAKAYVAKELRYVAPKGKNAQPHEGHHAEYAIGVWNEKRAAKLSAKSGKHVPVRAVDGSRKSELKTILRATVMRPDIVSVAWKLADTMTDVDGAPRTYEAIVKAATAQANPDVIKAKRKLSDDELKAAMLPKESEPDEAKSLDAIVKKLGKMAEAFPANAKAYTSAAAALAPIVSLLRGDAARAKFIEDAVANGHDATAAAAFYDAPRKMAA
jgi:hypothetical protein